MLLKQSKKKKKYKEVRSFKFVIVGGKDKSLLFPKSLKIDLKKKEDKIFTLYLQCSLK